MDASLASDGLRAGAPTRLHCRVAGRRLDHVAPDGSLAICPARMDCAADADGGRSTGFADESHLTRWSRRVHGLPPGELRARA